MGWRGPVTAVLAAARSAAWDFNLFTLNIKSAMDNI